MPKENVKPPEIQAVGQESMEDKIRSIKQEEAQRRMEKELYGKPVVPAPVVSAPVRKAKGGTASSRADGIAQRGKTRGKIC
jgi:hypothetical protein